MSGTPSWAATQRGPAQYRPPTGGDNASSDSFDSRILQQTMALGRMPSNRRPNGEQQQQQQQQQQRDFQQQTFPQRGGPMQRQESLDDGGSQGSHSKKSNRASFLPSLRSSSQTPPSSSDGPDRHRRTQSLRPFSAFQPLDQVDPHQPPGAGANSMARPPSPTGSTNRSIRTAAAPLTFKSPELRSALALQEAQQKKTYMEGYLSRRDALGADGKPLRAGDPRKSWHLCFVQLTGTVLSVWSVRQMEEAAREGREVPPAYINVTDSFVDLVGNLVENPEEIPGSRGRYENVFALNSAGNNRILFCVEGAVGRRLVQAWINGIRLASWEKVRLEEIYTGSLIRARLGAVGAPASADQGPMQGPPPAIANMSIVSPLAKGKMEGWVKARFMGSTEWKKCWLVLTKDKPEEQTGMGRKLWHKLGGAGDRSSVLSISSTNSPNPNGSAPATPGLGPVDIEPPPGSNQAPGVAQFFATKKDKKPFATVVYAQHSFAVYPSRPELVEGSSLFKIEGAFPQSQVLSATNRIRQTGWVMIMPELEAGSKGANAEMMKWVIAFMDAFKLYGRPEGFVWDARDPVSAFFAYPIGQFKDRLFLDRELAEFLDVREERHLASRTNLHGIMAARMRGERTPILPPLPTPNTNHTRQLNGSIANSSGNATPSRGAGASGDEGAEAGDAPALPELGSSLPLDLGNNSRDSTKMPSSETNKQSTTSSGGLDPIREQQSRENSSGHLTAPSSHQAQAAAAAPVKPVGQTDDSGYARDSPLDHRPTAPGATPSTANGAQAPTADDHARSVLAVPALATGVAAAARSATNDTGSSSSGPADGNSMTSQQKPFAAPVLSSSPVPSQNSATQAGYGQAISTDGNGSVKSGRQPSSQSIFAATPKAPAPTPANNESSARSAPLPVPPQRQDTAPSQPEHSSTTFGPSGRGAEAQPQRQPPSSSTHKADGDSSYDEGALFFMRSLSDQMPAPTPSAASNTKSAQQPSAINTAVPRANGPASAAALLSEARRDSTRDSVVLDTPSSYTQGSYPPTELGDSHRSSNAEAARRSSAPGSNEDQLDVDALAAYSYLDQAPPSPGIRSHPVLSDQVRQQTQIAEPQRTPTQATPSVVPAPIATPVASRPSNTAYPSSFGQNKKAQDRKQAAQAQAAAHQEALTKPGKQGVSGKKKGLKPKGSHAFGDESDEDEEEEEEEDDDDDDQPTATRSTDLGTSGTAAPALAAALPAVKNSFSQQSSDATRSESGIGGSGGTDPDPRSVAAAAGLPPPCRSTSSGYSSSAAGGSPQMRTTSPAALPSPRHQRAGGGHPALLPSVPSQNKAAFGQDPTRSSLPGRQDSAGPASNAGGAGNPNRQTFVQLQPQEQPGAATPAFEPHGLLRSGNQDQQERSAKQQEFEARQAGTGMLSAPQKLPEPQAGLLGAITAHERDRKGAGGLGATFTERERQRQREEEAYRAQQQQQQQQQQFPGQGGMMPGMQWGGGMPGMMNPYMWQQMQQMMMMNNPMMMGMGHFNPAAGFGGSQMGHQGPGSNDGRGNQSSPPPGPDPYMMAQQQQQMMAAQMAAQQAYMATMSQYGHGQQGGGSDSQHGRGSPFQQGGMPTSPSMMNMGGYPMPHSMSMYGMPPMMGPYGGMMGGGPPSEFGHQQQQSQQQAQSANHSQYPSAGSGFAGQNASQQPGSPRR